MSASLRVLFADDEQMARRRMRRLLEAMPDVAIVAECRDGDEALSLLRGGEVDVALLDVRMPGLSGLDVAKLAGERGVALVFTTAHPEHALDAFDAGAIDYVVKPVDPERLARALERARGRLGRAHPAAAAVPAVSPNPSDAPLPRVALTVRGEIRLVRPEEISHAEVDGALVRVWVSGEPLLTELSLVDLERRVAELTPAGAARIERVHRRALLNLDRVVRLKPLESGGYVAVTDTGQEVSISRQSARVLRKRLGLAPSAST